jgi:hypothetical protein
MKKHTHPLAIQKNHNYYPTKLPFHVVKGIEDHTTPIFFLPFPPTKNKAILEWIKLVTALVHYTVKIIIFQRSKVVTMIPHEICGFDIHQGTNNKV